MARRPPGRRRAAACPPSLAFRAGALALTLGAWLGACRPAEPASVVVESEPTSSAVVDAGRPSRVTPKRSPRPAASADRPLPLVAGLGSVRLDGVPHLQQKPDFCGEAAAAMALRWLGKAFDQDQVFALSGMDPARGMGATTGELKLALERIGFRVGPVWSEVAAVDAAAGLGAAFRALHADLRRQVPSIVCMRYDAAPETTEHFRLVVGFDAERSEVLYHEPATAEGAYQRMALSTFLTLWPLKYRTDRWTVIRLRLEPGQLVRPPPRRGRHGPADFAQHVRRLKAGLPAGFAIVVEPPFVVVGDEAPAVVAERAAATVRWAVEHLKRDYFSEDPTEILDVWLFRDERSYRHFSRSLFGDDPKTPYGYYSARHHALIMNIATGGGTLVHEIVHPFMEANFPACPTWFNEGLGSLYEQSSSRGGHIVGLTNWRLAGLQQAIRAGALPSFRALTATSSHQFYELDPGTNYAQARYLLYYLQERGLLTRYYRELRANVERDPTGYDTLRALLDERDLRAFQRQWEAYVLGLRFP